MGVRLAGFVIHGNNRQTLTPCLASLRAVCDEVLALDSGSTDGSVALARELGARSESYAWRGFGAARAEAVRLLGPSDYVFFLDSDEALGPEARAAILAWKDNAPTHDFYRLVRRDWVSVGERRFLYRSEHKRRLIRREKACWSADMIVHEALPKGSTASLDAAVEHEFVSSLETLGLKTREYALLWAVQQHARGKRAPPLAFTRAAHLLRDGLLKGAVFRGGGVGLEVARSVADYHVWKYRFLRKLHAGDFAEEAALFAAGDFAALIARVKQAVK